MVDRGAPLNKDGASRALRGARAGAAATTAALAGGASTGGAGPDSAIDAAVARGSRRGGGRRRGAGLKQQQEAAYRASRWSLLGNMARFSLGFLLSVTAFVTLYLLGNVALDDGKHMAKAVMVSGQRLATAREAHLVVRMMVEEEVSARPMRHQLRVGGGYAPLPPSPYHSACTCMRTCVSCCLFTVIDVDRAA